MEKYIKIIKNEKDKNNNLKVKIYYDLGGLNMFTHTPKKRGYYISVTPVERSERNGVKLETITAFTGYSELLQECNRKSKKAEALAIEKAPCCEKMIIEYICKNNGYVLEG
jgi:hypothetical protein